MIAFQSDWISLLNILLFYFILIVYPIIYPRALLSHTISRLSQVGLKIKGMLNALKFEISRKTKKKIVGLEDVLEFFVIQPVSLDPFGIIKKLEKIIRQSEERLKNYVDLNFKELNEEERRNILTTINVAIYLNFIYKVINHYIGMLRKTRNLQLAFLAEMQLPQIERIAISLFKGGKTVLKGYPIGDSIGPLTISYLISNNDKIREIDDCIYVKKKIDGKLVILLRAKGPGSRTGKIGRVASFLIKKFGIQKVITVDAASKLEGEKTGSIAEGVGVAIGGIGVEKALIEEIGVKKDVEFHAIVVKMSAEEAIKPMHPEVFRAREKVKEKIINAIKNSKEKRILVIGVGNSVGIPNYLEKHYELELKRIINENWRKYGKEKIKKSWLDKLFGL